VRSLDFHSRIGVARCFLSCAYLAAGLEVLALGVDALVVVDVVLPAVLGLVLVREAGVEAWWERIVCQLLDMIECQDHGRLHVAKGLCEGALVGLRTGCKDVSVSSRRLSRAHRTHQSRT